MGHHGGRGLKFNGPGMCGTCRERGDKIAKVIPMPERQAWQLHLGYYFKRTGHEIAHTELESLDNVIEGQIVPLDSALA